MMGSFFSRFFLAALLACAILLPPAPARCGTEGQHPPGDLVFMGSRGNGFSIYGLDVASRKAGAFTAGTVDDQAPTWSPDASRIAYASKVSGSPDIFIMDADGDNKRQLTRHPGLDALPQFSPDGKKILFLSDRSGGIELFSMSLDGSDQRQITFDSAGLSDPQWSPDGRWIVFVEGNQRGKDLVITDPEGKTRKKLTSDPKTKDVHPAWSPDGDWIAFASVRSRGSGIYKIKRDGSGMTELTSSTGFESNPVWSRDGQRILFLSTRADMLHRQIYVMNAAGGDPIRLAPTDIEQYQPAWSPDGRQIVYIGQLQSGSAIFIVSDDGSGPKQLTNDTLAAVCPSFSPRYRAR